jgi:GNAT superfamily N-acetyltransferase
MDVDTIAAFTHRYLAQQPRETLTLLGLLDGQVVTYTATRFEPNGTAYLRQGMTHPDFRGRGVYTTLLAHRLARAREAGSVRMVVQAIHSSSSPILQKYGFRRVCGLSAYVFPSTETGNTDQ